MKRYGRWMCFRFVLLLAFVPLAAANAELPQKAKPESLQRWREARFGMFIHWGPVSLKETGDQLVAGQFESRSARTTARFRSRCTTTCTRSSIPAKFDAKQWVAIAKAAGMKYMVLTAKHCDGFLLWDSKVDDYNIMHTPFQRDVCGELAKAAHEAGMGLGWYYSPMDWRDPDCRNAKNAEFVKRMQAELTELLSNYGKIDILWFDTTAARRPGTRQNTYALVRRLQPDIVIDDRLDIGRGGWTPKHRPVGRLLHARTDDRRVRQPAALGIVHDHLAPQPMGLGRASDGVKPYAECMNMLIRCAGGDGNMLLNVGPMPSGEIAPEQVGRLKEMGAWLAKYGESIYGTRGGPFKPGRCGVSTHKGQTIYLHVQRWPGETLTLPAIPAKIVRSSGTDRRRRNRQADRRRHRDCAAGRRSAGDRHDHCPGIGSPGR